MLNYFTLLGVEPRFDLDEAALEAAYIAMQQRVHPDRMIGKPDTERAAAIQQSMDVNQAYEALQSPMGRAEHLLALNGVIVNQDEGDTVKPSPALLTEMLELREALDEAGDELSVAEIARDIQSAMQQCHDDLEEAFMAADYPYAAQLTIKQRYLGKALEQAFIRQHQVQSA